MKKTCLFLSVFFLFVSVNLLESTNNVDAIVWLLSVGPGDEDKIVEKRFGQFQNSLKLVIQNYLKPYNKTSSQVSLIVFHSGISSKLSSWKTKTEAIFNTIKFVDVSNHPSFHTPSWRKNDPPDAMYGDCAGRRWREGYLFMNAFRLYGFIEHGVLDRFDYVMQLDTDLYFEKLMPFDLFERARDQNGAYVYHECTLEGAVDCVEGLPEALGRFIRKHRITPKHLRDINPRTAYAGNFGIFKMSDWRDPLLRRLSKNLVVHEQGVHRNHWPDQTVIAQLLGIFVEKERVISWSDLFTQKIIVHHSASLGKKQKEEGLPPRLGGEQNMMCKDEFGCVCSQQLNQVSRLWDPILSPARNAVVTKIFSDKDVPGVRVLYQSLLDTNSLNSDTLFVVLDFGLSWGARNLLRSEGMLLDFSYANKKLSSSHTKPKKWELLTKFDLFGLDYLDRVVYIEADAIVLRSIAPLFDKSVTPTFSVAPKCRGPEIEFNTGILVLDLSPKLLSDMIQHLDAVDSRCGFQVEDQSFLCQYFYKEWKSLGFGYQSFDKGNSLGCEYQAFWKDVTSEEGQSVALTTASIVHFDRAEKPWASTIVDPFHSAWMLIAKTLDPSYSTTTRAISSMVVPS